MRTALLLNPNAGKGRAQAIAASLEAALRARQITTQAINVHSEVADAATAEAARSNDVIIVLGGDGTVHHALPHLVGKPAALYHLALGTENLVARELGHRADVETAADMIASGRSRTIDTARITPRAAETAGPTPFVVMASIGPDASVVHRLDATRRGPISHLSYLRPILAEALRPALPEITIVADGDTIVSRRAGLVVVANARQYALRTDPAPDARSDDGLLDVAFFPATTAVAAAVWLLRARLRLAEGCMRARARSIGITIHTAARGGARAAHPVHPVQIDGEALHAPGATHFMIEVQPLTLRVVSP